MRKMAAMPPLVPSRVRWYLERARVMPPGEYVHRARQAALITRDRVRGPIPAPEVPRPPDGWPRPAGAPALCEPADVEAVLAIPGARDAARAHGEALLEGRVQFFGSPEAVVGPDPDWHRDAVADARWPALHWSAVNHRELGLDPKWIWELGRHQHIVTLARAWRLTGDPRFAGAAVRQIDGFLNQCPPGVGIHWRSGLELGIRLISWAWTVELLRGSGVLTGAFPEALLRSVGAHLAHLERHPSRYSSANNHLVGEAAGRAVGALCFPEVPRSAEHAAGAIDELCGALGEQVLPDGVDAEQAVGYHGFVLDLGLAVVACLARSGRPVPDELARPLAGIAGFIGTLASDGWTLPRIGDEDDGLGVDLGAAPDERDRLRSRLRSTRALLGADLPRLDPGIDEATVWLAGAGRAAEAAAAPASVPGSAVFPHGGYAVLRTRDGRGELRAVLDAGPLGLEPMAAHGHADLLSVCLAVDGDEALIDPGTFTYFGEERWRRYGRSTGAHSTITVDGRDHAEPAGRFLWRSRPAAVLEEVTSTDDRIEAVAHHDAYAPVRHRRSVALEGRTLTVVDEITGPAGGHDVELRWHLAPGAVEPAGGGWSWRDGDRRLTIAVDGAPGEVVTGDEERPLGFRSLGLEHREPSPTIVARVRATLPLTLTTRIEAGGP